jgi:predicted nucleic acid-binding Zn ribbon protein
LTPVAFARSEFHRPSVPPSAFGGARSAQPIGDLVSGALRGLGVPSRAVSRRLNEAWIEIADPAWANRARPLRLFGGVLVVGVSSASLRLELAQFHAERLLAALRARLPKDPITALRFSSETDSATASDAPGTAKTPEGRS